MIKIWNLAIANKKSRPTYFVSKNNKVQIWYKRLRYTSNAQVIKASKLIAGIEIKDNEYNPTKVFIDSDTKDDDNTLGTLIILNQPLY